MLYSSDYNKLFIIISITNVLLTFIIDYQYSSLLIYFNSLSINLLMFNDIYFEIKHHNSHINFTLVPKFYPSFRKYLNIIWHINSVSIISRLLYICYDFWTNHFDGFIFHNKSYKYIFELIVITTATNIIVILSIISLIHYSIKFITLTCDIFKKLLFNFINEQPLMDNIINTNETKSCWICDRTLKNKLFKKLNCPCNEYFHAECIDKYLSLYNNYCRAEHKIAKYEHTT